MIGFQWLVAVAVYSLNVWAAAPGAAPTGAAPDCARITAENYNYRIMGLTVKFYREVVATQADGDSDEDEDEDEEVVAPAPPVASSWRVTLISGVKNKGRCGIFRAEVRCVLDPEVKSGKHYSKKTVIEEIPFGEQRFPVGVVIEHVEKGTYSPRCEINAFGRGFAERDIPYPEDKLSKEVRADNSLTSSALILK